MTPLTSALFFAVLIVVIIFALAAFISSIVLLFKFSPHKQPDATQASKQSQSNSRYPLDAPRYKKKESVITAREAQFFATLQSICNGYFYIIPQAHLSLFLSEKVMGQDWKRAFLRINGKSVDFLVCKRSDHSPVLAIELDDTTHDSNARQQRDEWVNDILQSAGIPLFRTREANISAEALRDNLRALLLSK